MSARIWLDLKFLADARLNKLKDVSSDEILLDFDDETARSIIATYSYIQDSFKKQFEGIVKREKEIRQAVGRVQKKIKEGEARKDNPLAQKLRVDKNDLDEKVETLLAKKVELDRGLTLEKTYGPVRLFKEF